MQGKKLLVTAICSITAFSAVIPAYADMSVPNGWYLEANAGTARESGKSYPGNASRSSASGNGNVGYKFMPYFGLEAGYSYYAQTTIKGAGGTKAGFDKHYSFDLAGKGIVPITDSGFELFAKVGVARISSQVTLKNAATAAAIGLTSGSHNKTGIYLGLGGQYYVMPDLAIVVQWQRAQGSSQTGTFDLYTAGLSFIVS